MKFWDNVKKGWNKVKEVASKAFNDVVKVAKDAYNYGKKVVGMVVEGALHGARRAVDWTLDTYFTSKNQPDIIYNYPDYGTPNYIPLSQQYEGQIQDLLRQNEELEARNQRLKAQLVKEVLERNKLQAELEAIRLEQQKRQKELDDKKMVQELLAVVDDLIEQANKLDGDKIVEDMGYFSRLMVSIDFLNMMQENLKGKDGVAFINEDITRTTFVKLIHKFLNDNISENELEQFNDLTIKFMGKSLIDIGAEKIVQSWDNLLESQRQERDGISENIRQKEKEKTLRERKLKREEGKLSLEEVSILQKEVSELDKIINAEESVKNTKTEEIRDIKRMIEVAKAYQYLQSVDTDVVDDALLLEYAEKSGVILANWRHSKALPPADDMVTLFEFGSLFAEFKKGLEDNKAVETEM